MIRGEIWWADFGIPFGSEPGFRRPVLIVQDDSYTKSRLNTVIVLPLTTNLLLENAPGNVFIERSETGLRKDSVIVVTQLYAIDKQRFIERVDQIKKTTMDDVEQGIKLVLGIE